MGKSTQSSISKTPLEAMVKLLDRLAGGAIDGPELIADVTISWANDDASGTEQDVDITAPPVRSKDAKYVVILTNPSTETAIDIIPKVEFLDDVTTRHATLEPSVTRQIPNTAPEGQAFIIEGLMVGVTGRLTFSNPTVIGAGGAFTARVQVWRF